MTVSGCHDRPAESDPPEAAPSASAARPGGADLPVVALVGRPNVGKSTLLARATGRFAETANAPGTTVWTERRRVEAGGRAAWLIDLPGTSSLLDRPIGGRRFWQILLEARPDAILLVADAGDLARHLPLALACRDLGLPLVVALNLVDEAERHGVDLDTGRLAQLLVAPAHPTVGRTGRGVAAAVADAIRLARQRRAVAEGRASPRATAPASAYPPALEASLSALAAELRAGRSLGAAVLDEDGLGALVAQGRLGARGAASIALAEALEPERWSIAGRWSAQVERRRDVSPPLADRLARLATAPRSGLPLFVAVTAASFAVMMTVGGALSTALATAWSATASPFLNGLVPALVPEPALARTLLWGLDSGLLAMLSVGIPYVLTFYLLLAALEDSGYLTSAAVLSDRLFGLLGLPGRAAIPLLAAAGCNVPAIYGTRVLRSRRERLLGSFLVTMTPCSARSAVVVAALAPFAGPAVAAAAFAVIAALAIVGGVAANALVPGRQPALVLELAPLRRPILAHVATKAWVRFRAFVRMAAPIMVAGSIILGGLYESGLVWPVAGLIDPLVGGWLGLPSVAGLALVFAFLRKELALQLLVALAVIQYGAGAASLGAFMTGGQLFVYAVVTSVSVPCVATLATLAGEFGWRAALTLSGATLAIAIGAGGLLARALGVV